MAEDLETVKNSVDVLSEVFNLESTFHDISKIITVSGTLAAAFPVVGAILGLIGGLLPDVKHEEILGRFDKLETKIDLLRGGIEDLKNMIRWDIAELEYSKELGRIELGMKYCLEIGKTIKKDERKVYQDKLKELCAHENCALALNDILDGMTGNGILRSSSILDKFYDITEGNRPRISAIGTRLLQLTVGGMMVISTYDTIMHQGKGAEDITKFYYRRLKHASNKVKSVLNKCMQNFRVNMLNDLNKKLDEGGSNNDLVNKISDFVRNKYDWLENYCLVYSDLKDVDMHYVGGSTVSSLHRNKKCGIVFLRTKAEAPKFSNRYDEAYKIVNNVRCTKSWDCYKKIAAKTRERGIQWTGCAVIKGKSDLSAGGTFSTKTLFVDKPHHETVWLFFRQRVDGKAILLLN